MEVQQQYEEVWMEVQQYEEVWMDPSRDGGKEKALETLLNTVVMVQQQSWFPFVVILGVFAFVTLVFVAIIAFLVSKISKAASSEETQMPVHGDTFVCLTRDITLQRPSWEVTSL
jgi:hypothetical protein